jgi:hypothetical protein
MESFFGKGVGPGGGNRFNLHTHVPKQTCILIVVLLLSKEVKL